MKTSEASYQAGFKINEFYNDKLSETLLQPIGSMQTCNYNAMMCCFGRDRQYDDNNGRCTKRETPRGGFVGCEDADPGNNSNYCYTKQPAQAWPLNSEGRVHCHGLAWGDDQNDLSYLARFSNLFYVAMYDHMYTRGYVESAVDGVPMCGCIEDMNPVSRADCTQTSTTSKVKIFKAADGTLKAELLELDVEFNKCKGITYDAIGKKGNDLAAHVNLLVETGEMSPANRDGIFQTLVGDSRDRQSEQACIDSWQTISTAPYAQ